VNLRVLLPSVSQKVLAAVAALGVQMDFSVVSTVTPMGVAVLS